MKTTTLRLHLILALLTVAPCIRAMESNNRALITNNQNQKATDALLTESEQRIAKLLELKNNITTWKENIKWLPKNVFGHTICGPSWHSSAGRFGNAKFTVGWSHYSNMQESIYYVQCRKKAELTNKEFEFSYEKYFPQISLTDEVLTLSVREKLNYHLNTFIKHFVETACPEKSHFINSFYNKRPEEPDNLQESYELVIEIIDNLIKSSNQKMKSLAHCSARSAAKYFNEDVALMIVNGNIPLQMCEQILAELPQVLFEWHAKALFKLIPANQNKQDAQEICALIINRCLPPKCFNVPIMLMCLPTLPLERQLDAIKHLRLINYEQHSAITTSEKINEFHGYLFNLANNTVNPEEKFLCLALIYLLNIIPDQDGNSSEIKLTEINPNLVQMLIKLLPLDWIEQQGPDIFKTLNVFCNGSARNISNDPFFVWIYDYFYQQKNNISLLIKHLAKIQCTTKPEYSLLDIIFSKNLDYLGRNIDTCTASAGDFMLCIFKHFSPKIIQENRQDILRYLRMLNNYKSVGTQELDAILSQLGFNISELFTPTTEHN